MKRIVAIKHILILSLLIFLITGMIPFVYAGEKIYSGGPDISAVLSGTNEIPAGQQIPLSVLIENSGSIDMKFVDSGYITPDYLPTTARSVKARLEPGTSPVTIRSDPQIIGDLPSGSVVPVTFVITVPQDAHAGTYYLDCIVTYEYMAEAVQVGIDDIEYRFKDEEITIPVLVTLRKDVLLNVTNIKGENMYAGGNGYLTLEVTNSGTDTGRDTVLYLSASEASPVIPVDSQVYIGDFLPGDTAKTRFKVSVSSDADATREYPLALFASYKDYEGIATMSDSVTFGAGFAEKISFEVVSEPAVVHAGATDEIQVTYKNMGKNTVYQAESRISVVDPFTSNDDSAYIGELKPGESGSAVFSLQVDSDATIKEYALDSLIRYTDDENNNFVSDPVKILIDVNKPENTLLYISLIIIIILVACGGYYLRQKKKVTIS